MIAFLQQIFSLLITSTGSLAYNLVLSFSIIAALLGTFSQLRNRTSVQSTASFRRMLTGLILLLLFRLLLFVSAGLAWADLINAGVILPSLERGLDLLSLLVIIWLWAFPQPDMFADLATGLVALMLVTVTLYGMVAGLNLGADQPFNGSILDQAAQLIALGMATLGILFLVIRRPPGWAMGMMMLLVLGIGALLQLLLPLDGDYPGAIRLSQMIAYPLLIALPYRFGQVPVITTAGFSAPLEPLKATSVESPLERLFADWTKSGDPSEPVDPLASALAKELNADICLFLWPPNETGRLLCQGFDRSRGQPVQKMEIEVNALPVVSEAFQQGASLRLSGNSKVPDLLELAHRLQLDHTGSLLSVSVLSENRQPILQVILLCPYSSHRLSSDDEQRLSAIAIPVAHILQRNREIAGVQAELAETRLSLQAAQERMLKAERDRQSLMELVALLQPKSGDQIVPDSPSGNGSGNGSRLDQAKDPQVGKSVAQPLSGENE